MKKIFRFLVLSLALMGIISACDILNPVIEPADIGLGIKVFFPTKVVTNQPMTINGSGFRDATEIVFPNGVSVTDFEIVSNDMIRVNAPAGIAADGGTIIVRTATEQAESAQKLTVGRTNVSGFSKQAGEEIQGGEQITIYGVDLEFISGVELLDADGNPIILSDAAFYRKGTSSVVITIPKKVFDGTFTGKIFTYDGQEILLPELKYKPASEGGHWETKKTIIWENPDPDGNGPANWNGTYRFSMEGADTNNECIDEFPQEIWNQLKTGTFYLQFRVDNPDWYQVRVTNGHWTVQWQGKDNDFSPGNMADRIIANEDGTFYIEINFDGDPDFVATLDEKHLLFTGSGFTPLALYTEEEVWIEGGGHMEIVHTSLWKNSDPDGNGPANWNGVYRFSVAGADTNNECIAEFPQEVWDIIKTGTFYLQFRVDNPDWYQVRVTNGHWTVQWQGKDNDFSPGNMADQIIANEDGTFYIKINLSGDDEFVATLDEKHILFTGSGYTPLELYTEEEVWVGGDDAPKEVDFWKNDDADGNGPTNWNGVYRFCVEGADTNNECIAELPADIWNIVKTGTFYLQFRVDNPDWYQVRVTNGHWTVQWQGKDNDFSPGNMADKIIANEDGTFYIEINFSGDDEFVATLDEKHLLFTGSGYTPLKLYYLE